MNGWQGVLRYLGYAFFVLAVAGLVVAAGIYLPEGLRLSVVITSGGDLTTSEFSLVEYLQNALIFFCGLIFLWIAIRDRLRRPMAIGFAAMFLLFLVRELGFFLDAYLIDNLWQVLAALIVAVAGVYLFRHKRRFRLGWHRSWPSAGLGILVSGLLILVPFTQLVTMEVLWQTILGEEYLRAAKLAAEELMELGGYLLITIGSLEFLHGWSRLPSTRTIDRPRRRKMHRRR